MNGKKYVGQSLHLDINTRWNQHKRMCKTMLGGCLYNAYKKHGIENFDFKIICLCFDEACNDMEAYYISKLNTLAPNGYNLREGGNNSKHNEISKKLMSQNRKGKGRNIVYTEEVRRQRSERARGQNNPNYGKRVSDEQREKIRQRMKQIWEEKKKNGVGAHENTVKALQEGNSKRWKKFKEDNPKPVSAGRKQRVAKLDIHGNILEEFDSIADASSKLGIQSTKISAVCRHVRKSAGGFQWKYLTITLDTYERNKTTGEKYISAYKNGYMLRISKKNYKVREWFHDLNEAILTRNRHLTELGE